MVDKELIEIWRNMLKPSISSRLLKTNYEGKGEQDKEEFERDFDEILDLALIGLKYKAQLPQEDTTKDATSSTSSTAGIISRQFEKLVVSYPPADLCNYPEHKGKPYFSIRYKENGEGFIGYGTYNPEVLSRYLRDYFMLSVQPEERTDKRTETHASDLISRQAAIDAAALSAAEWDGMYVQDINGRIRKALEKLPPAQPERKKGKWIKNDNGTYSCSLCHSWIPEEQHYYAQFCLYCGADMRGEPNETD